MPSRLETTERPIGFEVTMPLSYNDAIPVVRDALKAEGFGVLTEIDVRTTFQEKLGKEFRPYVILGACNPPLAYAALTADAAVGLLLPCNVTVEAADATHSTVRLTDPELMLASAGGMADAVKQVAADAHARMSRVAKALMNFRN
jgi:uncharacterized protein (DUF302 family)